MRRIAVGHGHDPGDGGRGDLATTWTEHDGDTKAASPTYHERLRPYVDQCQAFALEGAPIMVPGTQQALDERNATFRAYAAKAAA